MTKLFITGGLGHIGSYFLHNFSPNDFESVKILDNLSTGNKNVLNHLPQHTSYTFIEDDILSNKLGDYISDSDVVLHLAAITNAPESFKNPDEVHRINFKGAMNVAHTCAQSGKTFVFPSTTSVYGVQSGEVDEDCTSQQLQPQSPYAESKLNAENALKKIPDLKFVALRLGTIFGASVGMRFHTAVNKFIWQAYHQEPITIWKTAYQQLRPYLDVKDALNAFLFIIQNNLIKNQLYNIVTANYTPQNIVEAIKEFIPEIKIEFVDSQIMNQLSYEVSHKKFCDLGFKFTGSLKTSIFNTIKHLSGLS